MSTYSVKLKTHSVEDITNEAGKLNNCCVHGVKPTILKIVAGRNKDVHYVADCVNEHCGKIAWSLDEIIEVWNKWNKK